MYLKKAVRILRKNTQKAPYFLLRKYGAKNFASLCFCLILLPRMLHPELRSDHLLSQYQWKDGWCLA